MVKPAAIQEILYIRKDLVETPVIAGLYWKKPAWNWRIIKPGTDLGSWETVLENKENFVSLGDCLESASESVSTELSDDPWIWEPHKHD